jgi:lysozyme
MKTSQKGIDLIKQYEGLSLKPYRVHSGEKFLTIGYGHYGEDVTKDMRLTKVQAEDLLKKDLVKYETYVNNFVKVAINQNQFDALVSFVYNLGGGALQKSTLLKCINDKDFVGASKEFLKWTKVTLADGTKQDMQGLVKRRASECALFLKPVDVVVQQTKNYRVAYGDTLTEIATKYKTNTKELMKLNPSIKNASLIYTNQIIKVPIK